MNIIDTNINLDQLHDGKTENICIQLGYPSLKFEYEMQPNYNNDVIMPKIIHFIWIGSNIPEKYIATIKTCKIINNNYKIICWVDDTSMTQNTIDYLQHCGIDIHNINNLLSHENNNLEKYILSLLNVFDNYGYKADIIRLYVVYKYGGIYSDIDSVWLKPLDSNYNYDFVSYRIDNECSNCTNSFFGFNKDSILIKNALVNLKQTINCFLKSNNYYIFKTHIPVITGPVYFTRIIKESNIQKLNFIHQCYNVIGGPHEKLYSSYSISGQAYCYQTFDKNWC
jgi:mannosyltransferase OCH1-like enzyme